jgi:5-formyltetrahydrofolate cyclo-ligase
MDKSDLRRKHLQRRHQISEATRQRLSSLIFTKLQDYLQRYASVGVYISTKDEVDTRDIIAYLFEHHKKVCVPLVTSQGMIFVAIESLIETKVNSMGILEPINTTACAEPELMIIPMLAFNQRAFRLGYGKAYYDGYLKGYSGFKLGLCFDFNEEVELMEEEHDVACDLILTNAHDIINKLDIISALGDV